MKIGICFPANDYKKMEMDELVKYLIQFKKSGLNSFDFYIDFFLDIDHKKERFLNILADNDIKVTMHYIGDIDDAINKMKKVSVNLKNDYQIPIVFHLKAFESDKYANIKNLIDKYTQIAEVAEGLKFNIAIETLSINHPNNQNLGDDMSEIYLFVNKINKPNFGICWDMGHTRLNSVETRSSLYLKDITKVMMTHIHNQEKGVDHIPFSTFKYQDDEVRYLIKNGYKGTYSLEFPTDGLKENIDIYLKSIEMLKALIEEEEYELRKNS